MRSSRTLFLRLGLAGGAILGVVGAWPSTSQAGDPFVAGEPSTRVIAAPTDQLDRAAAHARGLGAALGLPGVTQRVVRVDDRFEHRTYDEVTTFDAAGRAVAITRFDLDGTVALAVTLGWHPATAHGIDGPAATRIAGGLVRAAGLVPGGPPVAHVSAGAGGWSISWSRVVAGATVRGDGVRISLWPDGSFHGLTRTERPLAAVPARRIGRAEGRAAAGRVIDDAFGSAAPSLRSTAVEEAWVAANDMFDATGLDAPADTLRLAWIVRFDAEGALAERLHAVEVWIDEADGHLLGGDVAE
jgi:hypothetical protein